MVLVIHRVKPGIKWMGEAQRPDAAKGEEVDVNR